MARFPGRPAQINGVGRTRVSFRRTNIEDDAAAEAPLSETAEISRWCQSFRRLFSFTDEEVDAEFEGFAPDERIESKAALERKMLELGGTKHCADVLEEVDRPAPPRPPSNNDTTGLNGQSSTALTRIRTRTVTMRARPGMRDVVWRSYAELNKHGFDTDDEHSEDVPTASMSLPVSSENGNHVVRPKKEDVSKEDQVEVSLTRPCLPPPVNSFYLLPPPMLTPQQAKVHMVVVDSARRDEARAEIKAAESVLSQITAVTAVNPTSEVATVNKTATQVKQPLVLNPPEAPSALERIELSSDDDDVPIGLPPPVQRKPFTLPEKSARSSRIIFPKKRNMEDFEFCGSLPDDKRVKTRRICTRIPKVALSESDWIDKPAFWNKISEKHGRDCGDRIREKISRYTETMARMAANRKGVSPQRAGSSLSSSSMASSAKAALSPRSGGGSPSPESDVAVTERHEPDQPKTDKVAEKIQKMLRSPWDSRLDVPRRGRTRTRKIPRLTSSPSVGERAEAEQKRVSARLRTKSILRKARLKLNKRTLMKLRPPAGLRLPASLQRLSEQFRAEQDKVSVPFRLLKFPTVQLKAIDPSSATVRLPPQTYSSTSFSSDATHRPSVSIPFGQRGAVPDPMCSGAKVWPTVTHFTFGDITQHPNCGLEDSFALSSSTAGNRPSGGKTDDIRSSSSSSSIFSKLTLPVEIKSLPLINPYITISKLDTSKIFNNTIKVKADMICLEGDAPECPPIVAKSLPTIAEENPPEVAEGNPPKVAEENPPEVAQERPSRIRAVKEEKQAVESSENVDDLLKEPSLESNVVPSLPQPPRGRGRPPKVPQLCHQLWGRARRPSGPRVKHVCRRASVVLGLPPATFSDGESLPPSRSPSPTPRRESKAGLFFPGILDKLKNKAATQNGKTPSKQKEADKITRLRQSRCRKCEGCLKKDCRKCQFCLDRSIYGGPNKLKQACKYRICVRFNKKAKRKAANEKRRKRKLKSSANLNSDESEAESSAVKRDSKRIVNDAVRRLLKKAKTVNQRKESSALSFRKPGGAAGSKNGIQATPDDCNGGLHQNLHPSSVDVDFWEDYDLSKVWDDGMPVIASTIPVLRATCYLCASAGVEELVYCILCCEPFHPFCLEATDSPFDGNFDNWCCQRCQYCQVCGQPDSKIAELLNCSECHDIYHAACLSENYPTRPFKKSETWLCASCVKCKSCGATSPGKSAAAYWMNDFTLCFDCGKLFDKGNYCPICKCCYPDDDDQSKMVLCSKCDSWVHAKCANMTDDDYQVLSFLPDSSVDYTCPVCTPNISPSWIRVVKTQLYEGFKKVLDRLYNFDQARFLRTRDILSEKRTVRICISPLEQSVIEDLTNSFKAKCDEPKCPNDSLHETDELTEAKRPEVLESKLFNGTLPVVFDKKSYERQFSSFEYFAVQPLDIPVGKVKTEVIRSLPPPPPSTPPPAATGNLFDAAFVNGAPPIFTSLFQKVDEGNYSSVMTFCEEVVNVVQFDANLTRNDIKPVRDIFNASLKKVFPWFKCSLLGLWDEGRKDKLPKALIPSSSDHVCEQNSRRLLLEGTVQPSIFRQLPLASSNDISVATLPLKLESTSCLDSRLCVLCASQGDSDPEGNSRLIYCGQDDWIHLNCALWSAEVFEEIDGSLQRVHSAILRGSKMKCDLCARPGATVGCCSAGCSANYHFACAQRDDAVFQEDKTVYCRLHTDIATGVHVSASGFRVARTMYVDLDGLYPKWSKKTWLQGLQPSCVSFLVGSMTVESLGEVAGVSDRADAIIPINFCCTRLYWSTRNPRKRVVYTCRTVLDASDPEPTVEEPVDENHTIEHVAVDSESEIANQVDPSACLPEEPELTINCVARGKDGAEQLTLLICDEGHEGPMENLPDFCYDCFQESAITARKFDIDVLPNNHSKPPNGMAKEEVAEETPASQSTTGAKSCHDRGQDLRCDVSAITNSESVVSEVYANGHEENSTNKDPPIMESFAEALQELVCNVLHSGQLKLNDAEKTHSSKGKGNAIVCPSPKKAKTTPDTTTSKTGNENQNLVSYWNGSLLRVQHLKSDKRGCQNHCNNNNSTINNNNNSHRRIVMKNSGKSSSSDVKVPEVLLHCRKCNEDVKSVSKCGTQSMDLLPLKGTTSIAKKTRNGCLRTLAAPIPALICGGGSSGLMASELASAWCGDSDEESPASPNGENRDLVSLALSRACYNILSGGCPSDGSDSVVATVLNDKKIDPLGSTDQGVGVSQSTNVKTTGLADKGSPSSSITSSNVPFLETPPPGGGTTPSGANDSRNAAHGQKETRTAPRVVRGNPQKCPKCKRTYRTAESFQRHYQTCDFEVDSSTGSSSEDDDMTIPVPSSCPAAPKSDTVCLPEVHVVPEVAGSSSSSSRLEQQQVQQKDPAAVQKWQVSQPPVRVNIVKSASVRHPKRILPKTPAPVESLQQQRRIVPPANHSRTIQRVVRMVSPQAAAPVATQAIPSFVPQHQQHHVIQIQGRTIMIPICHLPSQQQQQQQHQGISYAEQLAYLGSLHLSSQGQLTSVSLNVPVSQFSLPAVGGLQQSTATFYQQQQHHLVQPTVHLTTAAAPCNQQQIMLAPQLQQHQVPIQNYSLAQQTIQQQQNDNWGQLMHVDMPNQFSTPQSLPDSVASHHNQHHSPVTCSTASQTQLSPRQDQKDQQQQFPPNDAPSSPLCAEASVENIVDGSLERRVCREAETSTDFDGPSLHATDITEDVVCQSASAEISTQTTPDEGEMQSDGDEHKNTGDDDLDETSEFADLLKKVSQQIASLASSKGRMACAILPAARPCSSRHSSVSAQASISGMSNQVRECIQVEPYVEPAGVEQRASSASAAAASSMPTQARTLDAIDSPSSPSSGGSRTESVSKDRSKTPPAGPRIAFEISSEDGFHIRSASVDEAWRTVAERVQEVRAASQMRQLSTDRVNGLRMLGVTNRAVRYVLEQLPGTEHCRKFQFIYHHKEPIDEVHVNQSGCARSEVYSTRKEHDMFNFLASRHRLPPEYHPPADEDEFQFKSTRRATSLELPMAMRFRHIGRTAHEAVGAYRSKIHGRGLFCKRTIEAGEMVIEYAGEVIRSILTDKREKYYDAKGIGCYMFKIDDNEVVDATMHGNAARFINHSCEPNCYSKVISVDGKKHIVIFALRRIMIGEELTYDYKFPIEDDKIPCTCGSRKCRRYLN